MMLTLSQSIGQSNQLRELPPLVVFLDLWIQVLDFYIDNKTIIQNPPDTFWTGGTVWVSSGGSCINRFNRNHNHSVWGMGLVYSVFPRQSRNGMNIISSVRCTTIHKE